MFPHFSESIAIEVKLRFYQNLSQKNIHVWHNLETSKDLIKHKIYKEYAILFIWIRLFEIPYINCDADLMF